MLHWRRSGNGWRIWTIGRLSELQKEQLRRERMTEKSELPPKPEEPPEDAPLAEKWQYMEDLGNWRAARAAKRVVDTDEESPNSQ
jgi:hypothetical protein